MMGLKVRDYTNEEEALAEMEKMTEFNLWKKIFTANNKSKTFIELHNLEIILKEFIEKGKKVCEEEYVNEDVVLKAEEVNTKILKIINKQRKLVGSELI